MYTEGELLADIERDMENESYPCPSCNGTGYHEIYMNEYDLEDMECSKCIGTGLIKVDYDD